MFELGIQLIKSKFIVIYHIFVVRLVVDQR
jgi:hypothetical protein